MPAYMKLGDIEGEATDPDHDKWIKLESMSSPIFRSIPEGAVDNERTRGETTLGDIVIVRQLDKSSVKLQEACAKGKFFEEVEIDFCVRFKEKDEPYLKYKLKNVITTSYSFHGTATGEPVPTEEVTLGYSEIEWTYFVVNPKTGDSEGQVMGSYTVSG